MMSTLREWAPLSDLFNLLPTKVQNGLFTQDIKLTSVDILPEFVALGTNFGLVYWYDRKRKDIQKLRCEDPHVPITVVKIISTVDYMVACGGSTGSINIFQVPKTHHESLPENLRPKDKQVERYTVTELHNTPVTALEWSKNGMKLFSGDKAGHVILTEIDFYMHLCKSVEILNETYEVVQLSYFNQLLLVSTTYRSIICKKEDKWKISQVGKRDRKTLGNFGGTFYQNSLRPNDAIVYCIRPGLRIWVSDLDGSVQQTLLFKDLLTQLSPEVMLINPISKSLKNLLPQKEATFGILYPFRDNLLVTYSNDVLYILNPKELVVTTVVNHLRGILSISIHKDEIFILEGERSLIRLSDKPEPLYETVSIETPNNFSPLTNLFKGLSNKLQTSNIMSAIPTIANELNVVQTDPTSISNAEEARESPFNTPIKAKQKIYEEISNQEFDNSILFKHKRPRKPDVHVNVSSCSSVSSDDNEGCISKGTLMTVSTIGVLPDLRSPETIKQDIEIKEKQLAAILCLDKVKISSNSNNLPSNVILESENQRQELSEELDLGNEKQINTKKQNEFNIEQELTDTLHLPGKKKLILAEEGITDSVCSTSQKMPVCMNIPTDWQLQNLNLVVNRSSNTTNNDDKLETASSNRITENINNPKSATRLRESSVSELSGEWEII